MGDGKRKFPGSHSLPVFFLNPATDSGGALSGAEPQSKLNLMHFKWKNLASGENNFSDVHEELYWLSPCLRQNTSPNFIWSICSNVYTYTCTVDAPAVPSSSPVFSVHLSFLSSLIFHVLSYYTFSRCEAFPLKPASTIFLLLDVNKTDSLVTSTKLTRISWTKQNSIEKKNPLDNPKKRDRPT